MNASSDLSSTEEDAENVDRRELFSRIYGHLYQRGDIVVFFLIHEEKKNKHFFASLTHLSPEPLST